MSHTARLYEKVSLNPISTRNSNIYSTMYKGFSTVSTNTENFKLFDIELVKQDLINHFHIRQGEKLMNPTFGTIIWDLLFEPLTEELKNLILQDVNTIINYDPRIRASEIIVTQYESGIQIECSITYLPYNISQSLQLRFDQANGLLIK